MRKRNILDDLKFLIRATEGTLEIGLLTIVFYGAWKLGYWGISFPEDFGGTSLYLLLGVYALTMTAVFFLCDCFRYGHAKLIDLAISQWLSVFIVDVIIFFVLCLVASDRVRIWPIFTALALDCVLSFACCALFTRIYHSLYVPRNMLLIYEDESALDLKFKMDARRDKYSITEVISVKAGLPRILSAIDRHDAVVINDVDGDERNALIKYCYARSIRTYVVPQVTDIILSSAQDVTLLDTPLKLVRGRGLTVVQRICKRAMDIVLCLIALIPAAPIMLVTALAIKLEDGGPVFYRQKRVTRDGKVFEILKFRSMIVDAEKNGYDLSMRANGKDPRITKVGSLIRGCRVDELPQILNILRGDMSIVGPRPERVENVEAYSREFPEWHYRERVKAGLTGYAQIFGKYNTTPEDKLRLDLIYIENYSLLLDIKLIFMTGRVLFSKESTEGFEMQEQMRAYREETLKNFTAEDEPLQKV